MKTENIIVDKSKAFAIRIVKLSQYLSLDKKEYVLSKQVLRSGTSIGANVKEAIRAQSKADFISKMSIALKEASEAEYWLELLHETGYITENQFNSIIPECVEVIKIITSIINSAKKEVQ